MSHSAALVFNATDPCRVCDQPNFLTVFTLDKAGASFIAPRTGVRMNGHLVSADKCMNCGSWTRAVTRRAGPTHIKRPVRPEVVASLRMKVKIR